MGAKLEELKQQEINPDNRQESLRQDEIKKTTRQIEGFSSSINNIERKISVREKDIDKLKKILIEIKISKYSLEETCKLNDGKIKEYYKKISEFKEKKSTLESVSVAKDKYAENQKNIRNLNRDIGGLDTEIAKLKKENIALELRIRYADLNQEQKDKKLKELEVQYASFLDTKEKKNELRNIATQKDSTGARKNLGMEQDKKNKFSQQLAQLNLEEIRLQSEKDSLQILIAHDKGITPEEATTILSDLQNAKAEGNKFTKSHPLNKGEIDQHENERAKIGKKIDNAKHCARFFISNSEWDALEKALFNIQNKKDQIDREIKTVDRNIEKLEKEIHGFENFEKQREKLIESLPQLQQELEMKKQQFDEIPQEGDEDTYEFIELVKVQNNYDLKNISNMLKYFQNALSAADTNSTIILAIINFVSWHKEYCGEAMAQKIEQIISSKLIKDLRGFRNRAMHGLDFIDNLNAMTSASTGQSLEGLKDLVLSMFICLQNETNKDYLCGLEAEVLQFSSTSAFVEKIESCLPELKVFLDESGNKRKLKCGEQLDFITSAVLNSKAIIAVINQSLSDDMEQFPLGKIIEIMSKPNNELALLELKIKLKYDALLQSLGQAIGNLQQYAEADLMRAVPISLNEIENGFYILNKLVPQIKDYRNSRAHSGYYNQVLFVAVLTDIASDFKEINHQLDVYLERVEKALVSESILEIDDSSKTVTCQLQ